MRLPPPISTRQHPLLPYTTRFRSGRRRTAIRSPSALPWSRAGRFSRSHAGRSTCHLETTMTDPATQSAAPAYTPHPFDARGIDPRFRPSAIFGPLSALEPAAAMRFVNDHHPLHPLDQPRHRFGEQVAIVSHHHDQASILIDSGVTPDSQE